jgi:RNA polymerase sigma factor (sigma-70 family)
MPASSTTVLRQYLRQAAGGEMAALCDRELLRFFADTGDQAAFGTLFRRHLNMVLGVCRRVLPSEQDAEDACQATFLVLSRKAKTQRWQASVANWLYLTARRVAHNARVAAVRRSRREQSVAVSEAIQPVDRMTGRELLALLDEELDKLPPRYREPLVLCYLEGLTRDEAAARLGVPVATLKSQLDRGRRRLNDALTRRGCALGAGLLAIAGTSPARASSLRLIRGVVASAGGAPSPHVAKLAEGVAMGKTWSKAVAALLLVASIGAVTFGLVAAQPPAATKTASGDKSQAGVAAEPSISGRVVGPDGKTVAGAKLYVATVTAFPFMQEPVVEVRGVGSVDAGGCFTVSVAPAAVGVPQPYLFAHAPGFGLDWLQLPGPRDSKLAGEQTLRLSKDAPIRGRLVSTEGKPVSGATITVSEVSAFERLDDFLRVYSSDGGRTTDAGTGTRHLYAPLNGVLAVQRTDKDGRFSIHGIGAERLCGLKVTGADVATTMVLVFNRAGFDAKEYFKQASPGGGERTPLFGPSFECVVDRGIAAEGVVREAGSGKPIAGATIRSRGVATVTDSAGHYRLTGMWRYTRQYILEVDGPENSPLIGRVVRLPASNTGQSMRADVELTKGVVVTGRVYDKSTGKNIPECVVHFAPLPDNKWALKSQVIFRELRCGTGADGRYRFAVFPGPGVLLASVPSTLLAIDGVPICPYRPLEFDAEEQKRVTVTGQLKPYRALATASGLDPLDDQNAGKVLDLEEGADPLTYDLAVDAGKTVTVKVEDPEGNPVAGSLVAGVSTLPHPGAMRMVQFKTDTGRLYALNPDQPRPVIFLHPERKLVGLATVRGDEKEPLSIRLKAPAILTGRALDQDGQPIAGADVYARYSTPAGQLVTASQERSAPPRTDNAGHFRLDTIVPGLSLKLGFRKGRQVLFDDKAREIQAPESGKLLDLGDVQTKSRPAN